MLDYLELTEDPDSLKQVVDLKWPKHGPHMVMQIVWKIANPSTTFFTQQMYWNSGAIGKVPQNSTS